MAAKSKNLANRLLRLVEETGYPLVQNNGQRNYGPPPNWVGPPPPRGSEVFVGKLPREIFEDDLVPVFSKVGKIYEMRLMMDFSGSNRGYAFVTYSNIEEACRAIKELNGYEIIQGRCIGVVKSVDNCRLFIGRIPRDKVEEEIRQELSKKVNGIVDVILYRNCHDRNSNRGFAFVEFVSHRAAAMARRALVPGCAKMWGQEVTVDWAEPEPDIDDDQMRKVKVLYVRNFLIKTTPDTIKSIFEKAISPHKVEKVKKMYDYAFIHFHTREHAEQAMQKLQNSNIDGIQIEIKWAKPVERELYRIQKRFRGNAKFNRTGNISQTMCLYKQHKNKREYEISPKEDEGIGSAYAGSMCGSPVDMSPCPYRGNLMKGHYLLAPARLEALCNRYMWAAPVYQYQNYMDPCSNEIWIGRVDLPYVGLPLLTRAKELGPLVTGACCTKEQATVDAAYLALAVIQSLLKLRADMFEPIPTPSPIQSVTPMSSVPPMQSMYPALMSPMSVQIPYMSRAVGTSIYSQQIPYWPSV